MRKTLDEAIDQYGDWYLICGMGDDSLMMIASAYERGYEPKAVIFCDTGNEWPHTYKMIADLSMWMMSKNWSKLIILKKRNGAGEVISVYGDNFKNGRMPSVVYGFASCSIKFKAEVVDKYLSDDYECWWQWGKTQKRFMKGSWSGRVVKAIGINADEDHRINKWSSDDRFEQVFPLVDWDIGEAEAADAVKRVGLYMPGKSACFMCPNSKASEVVRLYEEHPDLYEKAIAMEKNVIAHGNDIAQVDRVFIVDDANGVECKLPASKTRKTDKTIDLELTENRLSKKDKKKFGLDNDDDQFALFANAKSRLEVRTVTEPTNFVGLGRSCSWEDVVKYYQVTGKTDEFDFVGGTMCADSGCGT